MKKLERRYVYDKTANKVMLWVYTQKSFGLLPRTPNGKDNFPFYLELYIKELEKK